MTAVLEPNFIVRPYRGVSVQSVPTLEPAALRQHLLARRVYRRTEFLVAERDGERAIVRIARRPGDEVLVPVADAEVVATRDEVAFVDSPATDTGNATQLAAAAAASGARARVYVVQGLHQHVNFIVDPRPVTIDVVEVVPPEPPKLVEMARAMVAIDEQLPPVALRFAPIDLRRLIDQHPAPSHMLPCRGGDLPDDGSIMFLDEGAEPRAGTLLIGCERSRQIYAAMHGAEPDRRVDFCPRVRTERDPPTPTLIKCCLRERGIELRGPNSALVPWGASLDEVRSALRLLCGLDATVPAPVVAVAPEAVPERSGAAGAAR